MCAIDPINTSMKTLQTLFLAGLLVSAISCKKDNPDPIDSFEETISSNFTEIASQTIDSYTLTIYAQSDLIVGYNEIYMLLMDADGSYVSDYEVHPHPMMEMPMMMHATPFEYPKVVDTEKGFMRASTTFIMPSTAGDWHLDYHVHVMDEEYAFSFNPTVVSPEETRMLSFVGPDEKSYFLALVSPTAPEVGENNFEVVLYTKLDMMSFPAVTDATMEIEPWMPSMSHGSPNNVNPVHDELGHYMGKVNFLDDGSLGS